MLLGILLLRHLLLFPGAPRLLGDPVTPAAFSSFVPFTWLFFFFFFFFLSRFCAGLGFHGDVDSIWFIQAGAVIGGVMSHINS